MAGLGFAAPRVSWLSGPRVDIPLLIATPLLLIPLFTFASRHLSDEMIIVGVTLFGANAHHLPGLMRAYGDPAFRARFRLRLISAPIAIVAICLASFHLDLGGLLFVTFLWGIWHALAQVYGIGRMYDGRAGLISERTARLDKAVCFAWFLGGFLFSQHRLGLALTELYRCGIPAMAPEAIGALRWLWLGATAAVTIAWSVEQTRLARTGRGNPLKVLLFASSFGFWWYANIPIESAVVGVVLFEAFHDVQYLTTVWLYNQKLVQKGGRLGAFSSVLFRPGAIGIAIYVGLCCIYGSSGLIAKTILGEGAVKTLGALVLASLLLHFYYDSFLWTVRDPSVRDDFDLARDPQSAAPIVPGGGHWRWRRPPGLAWALFVVPLAALWLAQLRAGTDDPIWQAKLAQTLPEHEIALLGLASALFEQGRADEAIESLERAAEHHPRSVATLRSLVEGYARTGRTAAAQESFERLERLGGLDARTLTGVALLRHESAPRSAEILYLRALELDPGHLGARMNLASLLLDRQRPAEARAQLQIARRTAPTDPSIVYYLGIVELALADPTAATEAFEAALRLAPDHAGARERLERLRTGAAAH